MSDKLNGSRIAVYREGGIILPVELLSFNAFVNNNSVSLNWITSTETNNKGFEIFRKSEVSSKISEWELIGFVPGNGTITETKSYSFIDKNLEPVKYHYRLKQMDYDGSYEYSKEIEISINYHKKFSLSQNYPNPFNPRTKIKYTIPQTSSPLPGGARGELVSLKIYDILGNEITTLVNEEKSPGEYEVEFDASKYNLSSGIYFYQLRAGSFSQTKKLILMK